jgi:hypothetical protein
MEGNTPLEKKECLNLHTGGSHDKTVKLVVFSK